MRVDDWMGQSGEWLKGTGSEATNDDVGGDHRADEPGHSAFDDDAGDAQIDDEGHEQIEWRDPCRQADRPHPESHEGKAGAGGDHGGAEGHDLAFAVLLSPR